jgi:hypothetical protein
MQPRESSIFVSLSLLTIYRMSQNERQWMLCLIKTLLGVSLTRSYIYIYIYMCVCVCDFRDQISPVGVYFIAIFNGDNRSVTSFFLL